MMILMDPNRAHAAARGRGDQKSRRSLFCLTPNDSQLLLDQLIKFPICPRTGEMSCTMLDIPKRKNGFLDPGIGKSLSTPISKDYKIPLNPN